MDTDIRTIFADIFNNVSSQEQALRLLSALDKKSSFIAVMMNSNYDMARLKIAEALTEGLITQEDHDYVISKIPV